VTYHEQQDLQPFQLYFVYKRTSTNTDDYQGTFHAHQGVEILIVHEGKGTLIIDQNSYEIKPGMICIFQPYQLHHIQIEINEAVPFVRSIVHYEPSLFKAYFEKWPVLQSFFHHIHSGNSSSPRWYEQQDLQSLIALLKDLDKALPSLTKNDFMEEVSLFLITFLRTLKPLWDTQQKPASMEQLLRKPHQAERIMEWLQLHYKKPLRLDQMSKDLHLSPHHLSHLFKECTGSSISDYLTVKRMQEAVHLLTSSKYMVAHIAEEVGITNCSHFCKLFKTHFGTTPNQFRKQWHLHH
jgi:YesN/AraC family two-component response regulator